MKVLYTDVDMPLPAAWCRGYFRYVRFLFRTNKCFFLSFFFFVSIRHSRTVKYSREIPASWIHFVTVLTSFRRHIKQLLTFCVPLWWKIPVCGILSLLSFVVWVRVVDKEVHTFRSNLLPHTKDTLKNKPAVSTELRQLSNQLHGFNFPENTLM